MIISTDNDNSYSLTIMLPGSGSASRYETNVNVCPEPNGNDVEDEEEVEDMVTETHVSTMMVKGSSPERSLRNISATKDEADINPEDFECSSHQISVLEGMNELRLKGHLLDVTLWAENKAFQAHRVVLASCSDYFRAMFTDPMREKDQHEINLAGISSDGLKFILDYVYTSKLSLTLANIQTVLSTATHLQVLKVIGACSGYLRRQLDLDNCVDVIALAETYALPKLRRFAYKFISQNFMHVTKQQINRLSFDQLEHLLAGDFPVYATELSILVVILNWLQTLEKSSNATTSLLKRIDFGQISRDDLKGLEATLQNDNILHMLKDKRLICDTLTKKRDEVGLLNLRGMQLSIVKVGGFGPHGITNKIAYYYSNDKWLPLTTIPHIECSNFGCAVLQNSLFVVGGCFNQTASLATLSEHVHPFGFCYDPRRDEWTRIAPMNRERCRFTLTPCDNDKLIAIGGAGSSDDLNDRDDDQLMIPDDFEATVEIYDSPSDRWTQMAPMVSGGRSQHAASMLSDYEVIVSGGLNSDLEVIDEALILDLKSNQWTMAPQLPRPRADHAMVKIGDGQVLAIGGWDHENEGRVLIDTIDRYDDNSKSWVTETRIPTPRFHCGVTLMRDRLHIVGGFHTDLMFDRATGLVEIYDMTTKSWSQVSESYSEDSWEHACVTLHIPRCRE